MSSELKQYWAVVRPEGENITKAEFMAVKARNDLDAVKQVINETDAELVFIDTY